MVKGKRVYFESPLFGVCTAISEEDRGEKILISQHEVLESEAEIPKSWLLTNQAKKDRGL